MNIDILNGFLKNENDLEGWFFPPDMLSLAVLNDIHSKSKIKVD